MSISVFIDGAEGTTGLDLRERLATRDDLQLLRLDAAQRKNRSARREALNDADIAILCLPDEAAREAVSLAGIDTRIIDASSAHRTARGWTYGFAELEAEQEDRIAGARLVANPGCYPTAFLALVRPLVRAGIIPTEWPLSFHAASGYSGGGKAMIAAFEVGGSMRAFHTYALTLAHKHLPEMRVHAGIEHPPVFSPSVARVRCGMLGEVPLSLAALPGRPAVAQVEEVLREAYRDSVLVSLGRCDADIIDIEEHAGTDRMSLRIRGNETTGQVRLIATLDNLGKGAAGAAVQNLNIMAGLDPLAGLKLHKTSENGD